MAENARNIILNFLLSLLTVVFVVTFSVSAVLNFKQLYYFDIKFLNIEKYSGYQKTTIKNNYSQIVDYNNLFSEFELEFENMPLSQNARIHFREVKQIFGIIEVVFLLTFFILLFFIYFRYKKKNFLFLKVSGCILICIPLLSVIAIFIDFSDIFVKFHKIFFNNDYWIFDIYQDPIITILPEEFFMHCAILIMLLIVFCGIICLVIEHFTRDIL